MRNEIAAAVMGLPNYGARLVPSRLDQPWSGSRPLSHSESCGTRGVPRDVVNPTKKSIGWRHHFIIRRKHCARNTIYSSGCRYMNNLKARDLANAQLLNVITTGDPDQAIEDIA
jgi:hypothetical protein